MPITLTISEGLLSAEAEAHAFAALTETLLDIEGLTGNAFMTANIVGTINVLPKNRVFAGGEIAPAAFIELKMPEIALASFKAKQTFIERATKIVERASEGRLSRDRIWTNIVYAADGSWGIGGRAHTAGTLASAIQCNPAA